MNREQRSELDKNTKLTLGLKKNLNMLYQRYDRMRMRIHLTDRRARVSRVPASGICDSLV